MTNADKDSEHENDRDPADGDPAHGEETSSKDAVTAALRGSRPRSARIGGSAAIADNASIDDDQEEDGFNLFDDGAPERPLFPPAQPGHHVMDRSDIGAALKAAGFNGGYDSLSGGEEQRARSLVQYQSQDLWRPHLIGTPAMLERLDELEREQDNFSRVIRVVWKAVHLSMVTGVAVRIPPILIVGSPGIGKSRFARGLARCLETNINIINGSTLPDVGSITGYTPVWRGASQGRLAKFLVSAQNTSPIIFVDEADKISDYEKMVYPLDRILPVLELSTAKCFLDENLQVPMRAQNVAFVFACNTLDDLSAPFLDRVISIWIKDLDLDARDAVLESMLDEVATQHGLRISLASRAVLEPLHALGLRRSRLAFELAVAHAVADQRRFLTRADLVAAVALLGRPDNRRPSGFIQHPE